MAELTSPPPNCIDLVEEQHTRLVTTCVLEQLVQVLLALTQPHVEHVVQTDRERRFEIVPIEEQRGAGMGVQFRF